MNADIFSSFFKTFHLQQTEIDWSDLGSAIDGCSENPNYTGAISHRKLFGIQRESNSPWSGDEMDVAGLFAHESSGKAAVYFASNASGMGEILKIDGNNADAIQAFISGHLNMQGWGPLQFYGTTIYNDAGDLLTKDFFVSLLRDAYERHPDLIGATGEDADNASPADWVDTNYIEN